MGVGVEGDGEGGGGGGGRGTSFIPEKSSLSLPFLRCDSRGRGSGREEWAWVGVGELLHVPSTRASQCGIINRGNQTKHVIVHAGAKCIMILIHIIP